MRRAWRWTFVACLASTAAAAAEPISATAARASNPVTYTANDTAPDTPGAPDMTSIVVSDNTQGLITFQINFTPGSEQQSQDSYAVYIDSDENPTTGDASGAGTDYLLDFDGTSAGGLGLFKWDGSSSYQFVSGSSLNGSFSGDSQYFVIAASQLGIKDGFNFNVAAAVGSDSGTSSQVDYMPEDGTNFHYSMQSKATIALKVADWEDFSPIAGKTYATALIVTRSDTGAALTGGAKIGCTLSVRGRSVARSFAGFSTVRWYKGGPRRAAVCNWHLPAGTGGATLVAKESVTLGSSTVSRVYTSRIKK